MANQAQIDAIEHLLLAWLKAHEFPVDVESAFADASGTLMGENGPPGTQANINGANYLAHLKSRYKI